MRIPSSLAFGSTFGPSFATEITALGSGQEHRNQLWSQAQWKGELRYYGKNVRWIQDLNAFFLARRGKAQGWRFKHHIDYKANMQHVGVGDGVTTVFQLRRIYDSGLPTSQYVRAITKPVGIGFPTGNLYDSVKLYNDTTLRSGNYVVDYTTGKVTLTSPLPSGVTLFWSGEFDVPCRFDTDYLPTSLLLILQQSLLGPNGFAMGASLGAPQYWIMRGPDGTTFWFFWFDSLGQLTRDLAPPPAPFVSLTSSTPPTWHSVTDETGGVWYLFPDDLGQMTADLVPPAGTIGQVFGPAPSSGIVAISEDPTTSYKLVSDTLGQPTMLVDTTTIIPPPPPVAGPVDFDALGQTETIPIIELKTLA